MAATKFEGNAPLLLGDAVVAFVLNGQFPDDELTSSLAIPTTDLAPALESLKQSKAKLEAEISSVNNETKEDVNSWLQEARILQEDIIRSKSLANDIIRQSEAPEASGKTANDAVERVEFLSKEVEYNGQLLGVLHSVREVNELFSRVEQARDDHRILDSLHLLEEAWAKIDRIPVSKTCRVMKLLDIRSFELKSGVHEVFDTVWKSLVQVDVETHIVSMQDTGQAEQMSLADALVGLKIYKEVDERMEQLWHNLDNAIITPRMDKNASKIPGIQVDSNSLRLNGSSEATLGALLDDLQTILSFLHNKFPPDLLETLCKIMMDDVISKLVHIWLDAEVPSSLQGIDRFQEVIESTGRFCAKLEELGFSHIDKLNEWVSSAPSIWLTKCRETTLNNVRSRLSKGISISRKVEKVSTEGTAPNPGDEAPATTESVDPSQDVDWDTAWDDNEETTDSHRVTSVTSKAPGDDASADPWDWNDNNDQNNQPNKLSPSRNSEKTDVEKETSENTSDAWDWNDNENQDELRKDVEDKVHSTKSTVAPVKLADKTKATGKSRRSVQNEAYTISSMPDPVLELVFAIVWDGALLTKPGSETNPVAAAAAGLFSLPTFALALFRAIAPHYYSNEVYGSMLIYNDAMYLAERLSEFSSTWKSRDDISKRAQAMLRLDNDVKSLQNFANRCYGNEMVIQKTVLRDLLGGSSSLLQQDDQDSYIEAAVARTQFMAQSWEPILNRTPWKQAVGSLADAISSKLIADVMDTSSIGQDEAYRIAHLIAKVTELDNLFLPSRLVGAESGEASNTEGSQEIPQTAQYAASWLRLKFLSEVLQSNLNEVKFLWFDSELSLYFTADEVVDMINASFEDNARSRDVIRQIEQRPRPLE